MTGWRIQPEGIGKILTASEPHVEEISTALGGLSDVFENLKYNAGFDGVVLKAVSDWVSDQADHRLRPLMTKMGAVLEATADATNAYLAGDETMAASTITAAAPQLGG